MDVSEHKPRVPQPGHPAAQLRGEVGAGQEAEDHQEGQHQALKEPLETGQTGRTSLKQDKQVELP